MTSPTQPGGADWQKQAESVLGRKLTAIEEVGGIYCSICFTTFANKKEYDTHYLEHNVGTDIGYTCVVCHKQFTGYPSLRNHCYLIHVAKNKHKCEHCHKTFSKLSILNHHIDATHTFKCETCQKQFSFKKELVTHQAIHNKEKPPYHCNSCGDTIESMDMCEVHVDEHCTAVYSCPVCEKTANNKLEAARHLTNHFGEQLFDEDVTASKFGEDCSVDILGGVLCNYCDELFKNRIEFDTHFAIEHGDKELVYSCNICGKQFDKYHLFGNHCYYHISKDRFECTECGKTFPRLSLLVLHTEAYHSEGSAEKPFLCGACGHGFKTGARLAHHTRVVHHTCTMRCGLHGCDMTFEALKDLLQHQRSHRSRPENWCRQCGLHFTTLASCERHLDVHRKKHYRCPVCTKAYRERHLIIKHIPVHFEAVLHVCKLCGKVFNLRSRLVQHSKTHSDLRAYQCTYCNKGFMKPSLLEQHLNIHTGFRPFKCIVCPKTFGNHPNWYKHLRRVHNIDKEDIKIAKDKQTNNKAITATAKTDTPSITLIDNSNKMNVESGIDSTSSELSLETYMFAESDDSTMDSLDPTILDKDWCASNENSLLDNSLQYTDMLPVDTSELDFEVPVGAALVAESQPRAVLREYGPEFNVGQHSLSGACIELDDHYLPHIDPLLTIKGPHCPSAAAAAWEPRITKVYHPYEDADLNRLAIMNTDIY